MKITASLLLCFIIQFFNAYAEIIPATYIDKNNQTRNISIQTAKLFGKGSKSLLDMQDGIMYIDSTGASVLLTPPNAKEISFTYQGEMVRMVSMHNPTKKNTDSTSVNDTFVRILKDGTIKLFVFYETHTYSNGSSMPEDKYYFQKPGEKITHIKYFTFKKDMVKYFAGCPALSEKIRKMEYDFPDVELIAEEYNTNCK